MAEIDRNPRLVKRGDVIRVVTTVDTEVEDVVREVQIFVLLGNGQTAQLPLDENVTIITDETIPEDLVGQIEAMAGEAPLSPALATARELQVEHDARREEAKKGPKARRTEET